MQIITKPLQADTVLGIGAHPDDLDFTAAGTLAVLAAAGTDVYYLILTDGCKGADDPSVSQQKLIEDRRLEQRRAAMATGVKDVLFLSYIDGELEVTRQLQKDIVRVIRRIKPDMVFAMDPTMVYCPELLLINHPDHRAGGQAVLDAVYPFARDCMSFPELCDDEGLQPHKVRTVMLSNFNQANYFVDITTTIDTKITALAAHPSQMKDMKKVSKQVYGIATDAGKQAGCTYAEAFVRIDVE